VPDSLDGRVAIPVGLAHKIAESFVAGMESAGNHYGPYWVPNAGLKNNIHLNFQLSLSNFAGMMPMEAAAVPDQ